MNNQQNTSRDWESTQELGMLYESMLHESMNPNMEDIIGEKFDPKKADRNKDGKVSDWEEKIGKEIFGNNEEEDEDNENCGEEEEQDACYRKVKARYKVWPSAYASGALVKCRKVGAKNWGNSKKKKK